MTDEKRLILFRAAISNGEVTLWEDPGHSWIQVPRSIVEGLKISAYSYQDKTSVYLEEDLDVGVLANALEPTFTGWDAIPRKYEPNSHVRNLPHYRAPVVLASSERM